MTKSAVITSKGQVTIPVEIRKKLGLSEGRRVVFILENGSVRLMTEVEDPMEELKQLKNKVHFSQRDIEELMKESKRAWDAV